LGGLCQTLESSGITANLHNVSQVCAEAFESVLISGTTRKSQTKTTHAESCVAEDEPINPYIIEPEHPKNVVNFSPQIINYGKGAVFGNYIENFTQDEVSK